MINFKRKTRIKKATRVFENDLSRNEWILYMHLIELSDNNTLMCEISLRKLHDDLKMAINTIKSCRNNLKQYGLIYFSREQHATTRYEIHDIIQSPIVEFSKEQKSKTIEQVIKQKQIEYSEFNYDFVDEDLKASFTLFIKHLIEHEDISIDQEKVKRIYQNHMKIFNPEQFKQHIASQIIQDKRIKCIEAYNLTHIDLELKEIMEDIIWKYSRNEAPLNQREVDNIYMQVYIDCDGDVERMEIMLNKFYRNI